MLFRNQPLSLLPVGNRLPLMRDFDSSEFESLWRDVIEGIPSGSPELDAIGPALGGRPYVRLWL